MAVQSCEVEVRKRIVNHSCRSPVGIVVKTSNYCAFSAATAHFADRAQMISRVKISCFATELSLRIHEQRDRVLVVARFAFLHPAPNEFPRRSDPGSSFLDDLHHAA